jgi:hypothetical protein
MEWKLTAKQLPTAPGPLRDKAAAQDQSSSAVSLRRRAPHRRLLVHCAAMLRVSQ